MKIWITCTNSLCRKLYATCDYLVWGELKCLTSPYTWPTKNVNYFPWRHTSIAQSLLWMLFSMYVRTIQHLNYSRQESEKHNLQFIFLSHPSSSMAVEHRPCLLTEKKIQAFETKCLRKLLCISTWSPRPTTGCRARSTSFWVHRNLFWQLSRDRNLQGSGTTTASPKLFFRAP